MAERATPRPETLRDRLRQLAWFGLVGGGGSIGFVLLSTLVVSARTGLPDWLASALCYAAMVVPVYLAHRRFSFRSETPHKRALPRYVAVQGMAVALAALISAGVYAIPGLPTIVAAIAVSGLTAAFTFVVLKAWAFARAA